MIILNNIANYLSNDLFLYNYSLPSAQHCAAQHCAAQHCAAQHSVAQHSVGHNLIDSALDLYSQKRSTN